MAYEVICWRAEKEAVTICEDVSRERGREVMKAFLEAHYPDKTLTFIDDKALIGGYIYGVVVKTMHTKEKLLDIRVYWLKEVCTKGGFLRSPWHSLPIGTHYQEAIILMLRSFVGEERKRMEEIYLRKGGL